MDCFGEHGSAERSRWVAPSRYLGILRASYLGPGMRSPSQGATINWKHFGFNQRDVVLCLVMSYFSGHTPDFPQKIEVGVCKIIEV